MNCAPYGLRLTAYGLRLTAYGLRLTGTWPIADSRSELDPTAATSSQPGATSTCVRPLHRPGRAYTRAESIRPDPTGAADSRKTYFRAVPTVRARWSRRSDPSRRRP